MRHQCFDFLAAAAKHKGISPLQSNDIPASLRQTDQQHIDLLLRQRVFGRFLADVDAFRFCGRERKDVSTNQMIVNKNLGFGDQSGGA